MLIFPARIDFLNVEGDSLESIYSLRIVRMYGPMVFVGEFQTFYALERVLNDPIEFLNFLEGEGLHEEIAEVRESGLTLEGGVFYGPERFQEATTED